MSLAGSYVCCMLYHAARVHPLYGDSRGKRHRAYPTIQDLTVGMKQSFEYLSDRYRVSNWDAPELVL